MMLPSPSILTNVKVWHGTIAQVSYAPFKTNMRPTHSPLYSKLPLEWSLELKAATQVSSKETIKHRKLEVKSFNPYLPTCLAKDGNMFGTASALLLPCPHPVPTKSAVIGCYDTGWQPIFINSQFYTQAEQSYALIINPRNNNQKFKFLPVYFHFGPSSSHHKRQLMYLTEFPERLSLYRISSK